MLLTPELIIADANLAYLKVSGRKHEDVVGLNIFAAFPDNPNEPSATGAQNLSASLHKVLVTREPDAMALQRYDVEEPDSPGLFQERYWSPVNVPIPGPDGRVTMILHSVEEVSDLVRNYVAAQAASG